ncbi:MAG TPA: IPExxxVDY family protein [Bacteroidales bacterium]|nr:IPExxxVDY family protein [Bacteroidales bacterium]HRZ76968.1 IPExxxVDY family protein [Bacteroidales bacterium]
MARRLKLDIAPEYPYRLLGISCTLQDFRLAYFLSGSSGLDFCQEEEIAMHMPHFSGQLPLFAARDPRNKVDFFLLANKLDGLAVLVSERRFDYWLISGGDGDPDLVGMGRDLMRYPGVQFCHELDVTKLKDAEAFFTDLEVGTIPLLRRWKGRVSEEDARW